MAEKIVSGLLQSKRWKWATIILTVVIVVMLILNFQFKYDLTIPLIVVIIALFAIIIYILQSKKKVVLLDAFQAINLVKNKVNNEFPEAWHTNAERNETHVKLFSEKFMGVQFDDIKQAFVVDRENAIVTDMRAPDLDRLSKQFNENQMLNSTLAKEIKEKEVKEYVEKLATGDDTK